jgi:hypothetical protein
MTGLGMVRSPQAVAGSEAGAGNKDTADGLTIPQYSAAPASPGDARLSLRLGDLERFAGAGDHLADGLGADGHADAQLDGPAPGPGRRVQAQVLRARGHDDALAPDLPGQVDRHARVESHHAHPVRAGDDLAREQVGGAHEAVDEERARPVVDLDRARELLHPPAVHHRDAVGQAHRLFLVVGDQDRGDAELPLQPLDLDLHVEPQVLVERPEGLVEQQDARLHRERAGERDALLLAARELAGHAVGERLELHGGEHARDPLADQVARGVPGAQAVGDVLVHRHVREQRVVLEHHADVAAARGQVIDGAAVHPDAARGGHDEAADDPQQRGLATAARAQQGDQLARLDGQADAVHRGGRAEAVGDRLELDAVARSAGLGHGDHGGGISHVRASVLSRIER